MEDVGAVYLSMDNGTLGCDMAHRKVWAWMTAHAQREGHDHVVVLEDDAVPVEGFREQLEQALTHAPEPIVSLYLGRGLPVHYQPKIDLARHNANAVNACFLTAPKLLHAVGVAVQTALLSSVLFDNGQPIDDAWTAWIQSQHLQVAYTWPSIIQHRDEQTLVEHPDGVERNQRRVAWWFGARDVWTDRSVNL